ncbi:MAG: hypothetical protein E5W69_12100, partial [Mesorhizobium sp.]
MVSKTQHANTDRPTLPSAEGSGFNITVRNAARLAQPNASASGCDERSGLRHSRMAPAPSIPKAAFWMALSVASFLAMSVAG